MFLNTRGLSDRDFEEIDRLGAAREEAQREYDITPAGLKTLERMADGGAGSQWAVEKWENAKAQRAARIAAAKALEQGDFHSADLDGTHQPEPLPIRYARTELSADGEVVPALNQNDPQVLVLLDESEAWVGKLSAQEIDVLTWYSEAGYEEINGSLSVPNWEERKLGLSEDKAASAEAIALLDSALGKVDSSKEVVAYRRHFFYHDQDAEGTFAHLTLDEQRAQFEPGTVYSPGFYMSSSLDPSNIGMPDDGKGGFMVRLEIKTRKGAALPAVASQGTGEMEILMPRDAQYRVASNDRWLTIEDEGKFNRVPVIQLEEL